MSSKRKWDQAAPTETDSPAKAPKTDEGKTASEAAAAAAAIAAKIAAQFANAPSSGSSLGPRDPHDGDYTHDIDINDVRNRYLLTKGATQTQVRVLKPYPAPFAHYATLPVRSTRKLGRPSALREYGTQTARRLMRRTPLFTFTSPLLPQRCYKRPLTKSTS